MTLYIPTAFRESTLSIPGPNFLDTFFTTAPIPLTLFKRLPGFQNTSRMQFYEDVRNTGNPFRGVYSAAQRGDVAIFKRSEGSVSIHGYFAERV
jgi:hypothetical protein